MHLADLVRYTVLPSVFVWKFFTTQFTQNVTQLMNQTPQNFLLINIFVVITTLFSAAIPIHNLGLIQMIKYSSPYTKILKRRYYFISHNETVLFALSFCVLLAKTWADVAISVSAVYIAALFICFFVRFKSENELLKNYVMSCEIYQTGCFSKWRNRFQDVCNLVLDLNDMMRMYLGCLLFASCVGILGVIYMTTVDCDNLHTTVLWTMQMLMQGLFFICFAVMVEAEVYLFSHSFCSRVSLHHLRQQDTRSMSCV